MLTLKVDTDNAAFFGDGDQVSNSDARAVECARILRAVAGRLEECESSGVLRDLNGNCVGSWKVS